ncbi:hypothetical protein ScPMuIL_012878 [Solemya velum]
MNNNLEELTGDSVEPCHHMGSCLPDGMGSCLPDEMGPCLPDEMGACLPDETGAAKACLLEHRHSQDSPNTDSSESPYEIQVQVPQAGVVTDTDGDVGYLSNSTCSSSHGYDCPVMDQSNSQANTAVDPHVVPIDWSDVGCGHGDSEVDDLLYHFDLFFRERFFSELQQFQDSIHSMLSEQQIHVRQIIHTALNSPTQQKDSGDFLDHIESPTSKDCDLEVRHRDCFEYKESSSPKDKILLQLLSTVGQIGALLQRPQYKT